MSKLQKILSSELKPKEKMLSLAEALAANKKLLDEVVTGWEKLTDSEKGTCLSAMTQNSKENPGFVGGCLDFVIEQIGHKAPRVKWEAAEIVGHAAKEFPEKAATAIPSLLKNAQGEGTVIKWSAAFGLTEIAKHNPQTRKQLVPFFKETVEREENDGVKKIYRKALKVLEKSKEESPSVLR